MPYYNDNASEFFSENSSLATLENSTELPLDMRFNDGHLLSVVSYGVLFVISTTGNLTVFFLLLQRRRGSRSRINTMLLHLAIADLLASTFFTLFYLTMVRAQNASSLLDRCNIKAAA